MPDSLTAYIREMFTPGSIVQNAVYTALFSIIAWLWRRMLKWPASRKKEVAFVLLSAGTLFMVLFVVGQLSEGSKAPLLPNLHVEATSLIGDIVPPNEPRYAYVALIASVRNTGEQTSVSGYWLTARLPGSDAPLLGDRQSIPMEGLALGPPTDQQREVIYGEDDLARRTLEPLPKGGQKIGRLLYIFRSINQDTFRTAGIVLELTVKDSWGKAYSSKQTLTGLLPRRDVREFPGLRPQPGQPPPTRKDDPAKR